MVAGLRLHDQLRVAASIDECGFFAHGPARRAARSDSARVAAGAGLRRCGVSAEHIGQQRELLHEVRFDVFKRALRDGPRLDAIEVLSADTHRGVARLAPPEQRVAQELLAMLVARLSLITKAEGEPGRSGRDG